MSLSVSLCLLLSLPFACLSMSVCLSPRLCVCLSLFVSVSASSYY
jgi:hypothetical protein